MKHVKEISQMPRLATDGGTTGGTLFETKLEFLGTVIFRGGQIWLDFKGGGALPL